jgi:hypothetical protein
MGWPRRLYPIQSVQPKGEVLMFWPIFFFAGIALIFVFWRPRKDRGGWVEMSAEERYMLAKKIFTRDPSAFKDKDEDGVEDILEK